MDDGRGTKEDGRKDKIEVRVRRSEVRGQTTEDRGIRLDESYEHMCAMLNAMEKKVDSFCRPAFCRSGPPSSIGFLKIFKFSGVSIQLL